MIFHQSNSNNNNKKVTNTLDYGVLPSAFPHMLFGWQDKWFCSNTHPHQDGIFCLSPETMKLIID